MGHRSTLPLGYARHSFSQKYLDDWKTCRNFAVTGTLTAKYRPHRLSGNRDGQWECHIEPDWLSLTIL